MILAKRQRRKWRREALGLCPACGYSLMGNASGICPECGRATPQRLVAEPGVMGHHTISAIIQPLTVVLDLDGGAVVFVGEGKGADALDPFWRRLNAAHARIHAVATDMSPAYRQAVQRHLPRAIHVPA